MSIMTRERWETVEGFPDYMVSDQGNITNIKVGGLERRISFNQQGLPKITLIRDGRPHTRSPVILVAQAFVPSRGEAFNTPIHLDGDRKNFRADNLAWRPRWFAIKYHKQFYQEAFHASGPRLVDEEGNEYDSVKEACITNGVYFQDVIRSFVQGDPVFPDWKQFYLDE